MTICLVDESFADNDRTWSNICLVHGPDRRLLRVSERERRNDGYKYAKAPSHARFREPRNISRDLSRPGELAVIGVSLAAPLSADVPSNATVPSASRCLEHGTLR